ncbi:MAG: endonuclease/exonuclease/phosphatase family protein [Fidelibacterota bacterium]
MKKDIKALGVVTVVTCLLLVSACGQTRQPLTIGFWNVENLFDLNDDPGKNDEEFALGGSKGVTQERYDLKLKHSAEVLADLNADVVGLCEVENRGMLEALNQAYSGRNYKIVHYDSPDERGIDCALLYDPEQFEVLSSRAITNSLPGGDHTRDILYVEGKYSGRILHLFVNHWPSNYGGKEKAIPKRAATARLVVSEVSRILTADPLAEILLMGDFNENPTEPNVQSLKAAGLVSLMESMVGEPGKGTYVYRGEDFFLDQFVVSPGLQDEEGLFIQPGTASILDRPKYRQQEGKFAHYPFRFWAGNRLLGGYSDHLAIEVNISGK